MKSELLKCPTCQNKFDLDKKQCKILPCSCVMCLECLQGNKNEFGEYAFVCFTCKRKHYLSSLDQLSTSKIISHLLASLKEKESTTDNKTTSVSDNKLNDQDDTLILKNFSDSFVQSLKEAKADAIKRYETTLGSIDDRAERLIEFIHQSRETLQDQINKYRDECLIYEEKYDASMRRPQVSKPKLLEINKLESDIDTIVRKRKHDDEDVEELRKKSIKLQHNVYDLKKQSWYFAENTLKISDTLLGRLLTEKQDTNYIKIKNLKSLLTSADSFRVNLKSVAIVKPLTALRQELLPISKKRVIKIFFTTTRALIFELFDAQTGESLKSLVAFENLSSFPISCGYNDYFCVSFASRSAEQNHLDMNTNYVRLYDSNFNLIKSIQRYASMESIYMNESSIIVHYSHIAEASCEVYDYKMNLVSTFGQQSNATAPFYMEKSNLSMRQQMGLNFRTNARIFGFTEEFIYLWNYHKCFIMCRKSGKIVKSMALHGSRPYFLLDAQKNIIQVNSPAKKIALYNQDLELVIENVYSDNLDTVHINKQGQMAFADMEKLMVIYI